MSYIIIKQKCLVNFVGLKNITTFKFRDKLTIYIYI